MLARLRDVELLAQATNRLGVAVQGDAQAKRAGARLPFGRRTHAGRWVLDLADGAAARGPAGHGGQPDTTQASSAALSTAVIGPGPSVRRPG